MFWHKIPQLVRQAQTLPINKGKSTDQITTEIINFILNHRQLAHRIINNKPISPQLKYKYKKIGINL